MANEKQGLQGIAPQICPHCSKDILVSYMMYQPEVTGVFTHEEAQMAKVRLIELLETVKFNSDKEKELVKEWINDERTIFGMGDVESMLKTIQVNQVSNKEENKE